MTQNKQQHINKEGDVHKSINHGSVPRPSLQPPDINPSIWFPVNIQIKITSTTNIKNQVQSNRTEKPRGKTK